MGGYNPKTWNYERPINLWESLPWQVRWPAGVLTGLYFGAGFALPFVAMALGKL